MLRGRNYLRQVVREAVVVVHQHYGTRPHRAVACRQKQWFGGATAQGQSFAAAITNNGDVPKSHGPVIGVVGSQLAADLTSDHPMSLE